MADKKPTPRSTIVVAGVVVGGLIGVSIAQKFSAWALESSTNSLITVVAGAVAGGIVAFVLSKKKPTPTTIA